MTELQWKKDYGTASEENPASEGPSPVQSSLVASWVLKSAIELQALQKRAVMWVEISVQRRGVRMAQMLDRKWGLLQGLLWVAMRVLLPVVLLGERWAEQMTLRAAPMVLQIVAV